MIARVAAAGALVLAVAVLALLLLGDGTAHRYSMVFQTAGQLVVDDDVQVGGRRVGSIRAIELTRDNLARVEIEVEEPYAPLHAGTRGVIRATSLSGVANRYVALTLGPESAPELEDGAVLGQEATTTIVDLDQLFNTLDAPARADLQRLIKGFSRQYRGNETAANEAIEALNPMLSTSRRLAGELAADEAALTRFLVESSQAVGALADRRDDLASLVGTTSRTAQAIASESTSLSQALERLPATLRRANSTWVNLRGALDDLDALVAESKPATRDLEPFLAELRPLVRDARPVIADLRRLVGRPGADNDLTDATRKLPGFERVTRPAMTASREALQRLQPVLQFARPYMPDLAGFLRDFGQGTANYDANGHFARVMPIFNAFDFTDTPSGGVLTPQPADQRLEGLATGQFRRCPGAAIQPSPDGSSPYRPPGLDCDPTQVPPGS